MQRHACWQGRGESKGTAAAAATALAAATAVLGAAGQTVTGDAADSSARWLPFDDSGDVSRSSLRTPALMSARVRTPSAYMPAKFGTYADDS